MDHNYVSGIVDLQNPTTSVDDSVQYLHGWTDSAALFKGRPLLMLKAVKNFNVYEGY